MQDPRQPTGLPPQQPGGLRPPQPQQPGGLRPPQQAPTIRPQGPGGLAPQRPMPAPASGGDEEPIALVDDEIEAPPNRATEEFTKKIKALGEAGLHKKHHEWKRKAHANGTGAVRVRSFHGKYSDQGLQYLDDAINEWLDANPDVEVKFVTPTVGVFEGKIREPALVLNLWY
jgi:hypothetical protein